jgi:hypothetical protein
MGYLLFNRGLRQVSMALMEWAIDVPQNSFTKGRNERKVGANPIK